MKCEDCAEEATWQVIHADLEEHYCELHYRFRNFMNVTQIVPMNPPIFLETNDACPSCGRGKIKKTLDGLFCVTCGFCA